MRPRRALPWLLAIAGVLAPAPLGAADYVDSVDDFHAHVEQPGFVACTTYPSDQWDKVDCEGLSQEMEASVRAQLPRGTVLLGSAVHRNESWGFRVSVLRGLRRSPPLSAAEERRMIDETRARLATLASAKGGESRRLDARMQAAGDMRMVRVSGDLATEPPTSLEAITVLGASAVYEVQLVGPRERAADLAAIAERTAESVRVRPAPRWSHVLIGLALVAALLVSVLGTVVLVVLLTGKKRRRSSALAWPGIRG